MELRGSECSCEALEHQRIIEPKPRANLRPVIAIDAMSADDGAKAPFAQGAIHGATGQSRFDRQLVALTKTKITSCIGVEKCTTGAKVADGAGDDRPTATNEFR